VRVIAGTARGVRLAPVPEGTRPVSDRAREGVFSSLGDLVAAASVLDLYAGTGAMGIEALSRGADDAVFVDHGAMAVRTVRENLARAHLAGARVLRADVRAALRRPGLAPSGTQGFDLVFVDPPYAMDPGVLTDVLTSLDVHLAQNAMIVLTRPRKSSTDVIPVDFRVAKTLGYGDTLAHLIRKDRRARKRSVPGNV
jgi:16S rRNA (guanine966-N2)-methyltransferase